MSTPDEVPSALEIVVEEIGRALDDVRQQAAEAVQASLFEDGRTLIDKAEAMERLRQRATTLAEEWARLDVPRRPGVADAPGDQPAEPEPKARRSYGRLARGLRTPEPAFRRPILETLVDLGGTATISEVLDAVEKRMKGVLRDVDLQPLPSDVDQLRWRNTAQWARNELVKSGLMLPSTERGVWRISDTGRRWLAEES